MEAGILQLTVLKGRKNGETLVCKPGSKVRIGRVIRGNDFAMRDPGISENHLCFHIDPETSRWVVSDLGSSNGTILNESKIEAWVPVPISDSDIIKIGEISELGLKIVPAVLFKENEEGKEDAKGRRVNTRRRPARVCTRAVSSKGSNEEGTSEFDFGSDLVDKTAHKGKVGGQRRKNAKDNTNSGCNEELEGISNSVLYSSVQIEEPDQSIGMKLRRNPRRGNSSSALKEEKGGGNIGLKKGLEVNCEVGDHFEKLTLDQWFDSMELFLPKVIHDESEKIINILKEKARKFEEFIEAGGVRG